MEGKRHASGAYNVKDSPSRMQQDVISCSQDFLSSHVQREAIRYRAKQLAEETTKGPHVGIIGAGLAGLRCAEVLISEGVKVTILEGRSRVGGRVSPAGR
jgi:ribulose 1,5-bisphosphate synthetase/thiazole synthase